jgi:hypothetical protein
MKGVLAENWPVWSADAVPAPMITPPTANPAEAAASTVLWTRCILFFS